MRLSSFSSAFCLTAALLVGAFPGAASGAEVDVSLDLPSYEMFYLTDFVRDVSRISEIDPSTLPVIFSLTLVNNLDRPVDVRLRIRVSGAAQGELVRGTTRPFTLDPGITVINNQNLASEVDRYRVEDYDFNEDALEGMLQSALQTGYLPAGTYVFRVDVLPPEDDRPISRDTKILYVTNPTSLEMIGPGSPDFDNPPTMPVLHPLFQWFSNARSFKFKLAKKEEDDITPEDVMDNVAVKEMTLEDQKYQYLPADKDLIPGETYCWQVTALVNTSGGRRELKGEIFCFRVESPTPGVAFDPVKSQMKIALKRILGDRLPPGFEGMVPVGAWVNGEEADLAVLNYLATQFEQGKLIITGGPEELR